MINKLLKLLAILAFVTGLESAVPTALAAEKITVKLMTWGDTTTMAKYAILERAFEAANPDIDMVVEVLPSSTYQRKLPVMIASGTAPDLFECSPESSASFPNFASKDAYLDLEPLIERDNIDIDQWFASVIQSCRYEGKLYVLPKKLNGPASVHYNMDLFDAAGLAYPNPDWTWDDALAMARRLTRDLDGDDRIDQWGLVALGPGLPGCNNERLEVDQK